MAKIKIKFPQIVIETKIIEVSEEQAEDLLDCGNNQENFVWNNMTEQEQSWTNGKGWVSSAMEVGYCGISRV